jgi:Family of unknown function (DUF6090)
MIRVFRKLRADLVHEGKARNYLLYALGEIVLVIVGIVIALQVNNWNEERLEQRQVRRYAHALVNDLERDIEMVTPIMRMIDMSLKNIRTLDAYTRGRPLDRLDNLDLFQLTTFIGYRPYEWHRGTIEQMKNAGTLQQMRNFELANKIAAYEALTHHLDQDFADDRERIQDAQRMADQVVDSGYPINPQFEAWARKMYHGSFEFPSPELHSIYADTKLQILTDDIRQVRVMSNKFQTAAGMQPRLEHEIPGLVTNAREIIALLRQEYPE